MFRLPWWFLLLHIIHESGTQLRAESASRPSATYSAILATAAPLAHMAQLKAPVRPKLKAPVETRAVGCHVEVRMPCTRAHELRVAERMATRAGLAESDAFFHVDLALDAGPWGHPRTLKSPLHIRARRAVKGARRTRHNAVGCSRGISARRTRGWGRETQGVHEPVLALAGMVPGLSVCGGSGNGSGSQRGIRASWVGWRTRASLMCIRGEHHACACAYMCKICECMRHVRMRAST